MPIALSPSETYDFKGIWSGSITILPGNKPAILYTSINNQKYQVQSLAFPKDLNDPYLKEWFKVPQNPVIVATSNDTNIDPFEFRDPSTAWQLPDGKWRIVVGTQQGNNNGSAALYTSEDFTNWINVGHPLYSTKGTGMWECPDFFPVYVGESLGADTSIIGDNVKHVLKVSLIPSHCEHYTIGRYDIGNDIYIPDQGSNETEFGLRCDYGNYYASKSFFDGSTNRRITFGWVSESSTQEEAIARGWSGLQGIPRTIVLDKFGKQLVQWPIMEIERLRHSQVDFPSQIIRGGSLIEIFGITNSQADVEISFEIPDLKNAEELDPTWTNPQKLCSNKGASVEGRLGPFGLLTLASTGLEEYTAVFFRIFKAQDKYVVLMCNDLSRSSLNPTTDKPSYGTFVDVDPVKEELSLRTLIDHSIVESFVAEGKSCMTARVYPTQAVNGNAKLYVFNYGTEDVKLTKMSAWSMKAAQMNLPTNELGQ
ncbi:hypothetical protein BVRB_8g199320 [Beta vulgaris subsp. vulgaris]|nr:hypothetical protein BVRB_8g199320 [Beta vulgaris subsp. vulgaris]